MSDSLPESVVVEILYRLPPKTLVKCTSVCKAWNSIIKSDTFISSHLQCSLSNPSPPLIFVSHYSQSDRKEQFSLFSNIAPFRRIAKLEPPFLVCAQFFSHFVSTINGVVCLFDYSSVGSRFTILWNPLIRRHVQLPKPHFTQDTLGCPYTFVLGFGFDSKRNDYKVVRFCYRHTQYSVHLLPPHQVELYSLNEGAWRVIDASSVALELTLLELSTQCFLNGNVHWIAYNRRQDLSFQGCVLMFNVEEEKFKRMKLPEELAKPKLRFRADISVMEGFLSVIEYTKEECHIWMLKEYGVAKSWSKLYSVKSEGGIEKVLGLRTSGEVLVVQCGETVSLHSFNANTQKMTELMIQGIGTAFRASDYTGSLVLLNRESECMQYPAL